MDVRAGMPPGRMARLLRPEPFFYRQFGRGAIDVSSWILAALAAFALRFDFALPADIGHNVLATVALLLSVQLAATLAFQLHRQNWEKTSFRDARVIATAMAAATAVSTATLGVFDLTREVPITVPLLAGTFSTLLMLTARGYARYRDDHRRAGTVVGKKRRNVLVIGAGEAGSMLVREMQRHPEAGLIPIAFVDDDPGKLGQLVSRVPVVGGLTDLGRILRQHSIHEVLIAIPSADGRQIRHIVELIRQANPRIPYRTMPSLADLISGTVTVSRIRDVGIDDLLRRPPIKLDTDSILGYLKGKTVMVTGAGGSIGSELVRQICRFSPQRLVLYGHGENSIYQLERELDRTWPSVPYVSVIGAVQNVVRLEHIFRTLEPDVVFHAAAHKHVPLMEFNPEEAVFNNVVGSRNLVDLALEHGVSHFVNVSTDKAVNPTSVMGASKRLVELLVQQASRRARPGQVFVSVRFGNVLGSRGSAVPVFKQQIKDGGPVTITHPDMVRYFMTIPEASQLVLQASALGRNGEIFILDMGEPVKVIDLARDLIRLSGLEPNVDIAIEYTGIRPGEKLVEELMTEYERNGQTEHEKIFIARPNVLDAQVLDDLVNGLVDAAMQSDGEAIRRLLGVGGPVPGLPVAESVPTTALPTEPFLPQEPAGRHSLN
jgi:FlaA1/EpsC-like NDP-sugar epimerase